MGQDLGLPGGAGQVHRQLPRQLPPSSRPAVRRRDSCRVIPTIIAHDIQNRQNAGWPAEHLKRLDLSRTRNGSPTCHFLDDPAGSQPLEDAHVDLQLEQGRWSTPTTRMGHEVRPPACSDPAPRTRTRRWLNAPGAGREGLRSSKWKSHVPERLQSAFTQHPPTFLADLPIRCRRRLTCGPVTSAARPGPDVTTTLKNSGTYVATFERLQMRDVTRIYKNAISTPALART